jgi:Transposase DDE domain
MPKKTSYRIRNWPAYNAALIGRGSLTLWVDEAAIRSWRYTGPTQRGAQYHYADTAISCVLTLRAVYHLALRTVPAPPVYRGRNFQWRSMKQK